MNPANLTYRFFLISMIHGAIIALILYSDQPIIKNTVLIVLALYSILNSLSFYYVIKKTGYKP